MIKFRFPHKYPLKNGETVTIDYLKTSQYKEFFDFLTRLRDEDKLYMKYDVTNLDYVKERIQAIDENLRISLVAWNDEEQIVGEATVYWSSFGWKSHIGKLRITVADNYRRLGLSKYMAQLIFFKAQELSLTKIIGEIVAIQKVARRIMKSLGFQKEAVLHGFARDNQGNRHDIILMSADLERLLDRYENMVWDQEHKGG